MGKISSTLVGLLMVLAVGTASAGFTDANLAGNWACQMQGGFVAQASSQALMQIHGDGAGNIVSPNVGHPGVFQVSIGEFGTNQVPNPSSNVPAFYFQASAESCQYQISTSSGSTYVVNKDGTGTLTLNWSPKSGNPGAFVNCTTNIATHFNILLGSATSFSLMSSDLLGNSCNGSDYSTCGSSFVGTCTLQ